MADFVPDLQISFGRAPAVHHTRRVRHRRSRKRLAGFDFPLAFAPHEKADDQTAGDDDYGAPERQLFVRLEPRQKTVRKR